RHFVEKEKISDICSDLDIHVNQFYRWQGELFSQGGSFFKKDNVPNKELKELKTQVDSLSKQLVNKDSVIAEITEDYVRLKKKNLVNSVTNGWSQ
ncbi:MAG: hypothetical protein GY777_31920, partial [Candidatus Brocadiaceae bacterium]|nr:hypothetical protein [Candidatus Brocadiaceae bacterium]